jgi:hypothetical protein
MTVPADSKLLEVLFLPDFFTAELRVGAPGDASVAALAAD